MIMTSGIPELGADVPLYSHFQKPNKNCDPAAAAALKMVSCLRSHGTMAAAVAVFLIMPAPGRASPVNARGLRDGSQNRSCA